MFSFYPKNGRTGSRKSSIIQAWLVEEGSPNPHWVTFLNLLSIGLRYTLLFEWSDFSLKYLFTVMIKGQLPKFKARVWISPISEIGSKCNSVFRHADSNWVMIMELERKMECSWACTFWAELCLQGYRSLPWTWDRVRYKLSIATGVTITAIYFLNLQYMFVRFVVDA